MTEGIEQLNQEKIRKLEKKGNLPILRNIGSRHPRTSQDEKKYKKECLENEKTSQNLIKGIDPATPPL